MALDLIIFRMINGAHSSVLDALFLGVSFPAEYGAAWVALSLLLYVFGSRTTKSYAAASLFAIIVADLIIGNLVSSVVFRQRPYLALSDVHQLGLEWQGSSFPSTHATISFASACVLGQIRRNLFPLMLGLAALIGVSRVYLGMHYPSDILAGALIGVLTAWLTLFVWKRFKVKMV